MEEQTTPQRELQRVKEFKEWLSLACPGYRVSSMALVDDRTTGKTYPTFVVQRVVDASLVGRFCSVDDAFEAIRRDQKGSGKPLPH